MLVLKRFLKFFYKNTSFHFTERAKLVILVLSTT